MNSESDFNDLERAVLAWMIQKYENPELTAQINSAVFRRREWTEVGFYIYFDVPKELAPIDLGQFGGNWPIQGAVSMVWGTDGLANCIEMAAFGSYFNEHVREFQLLAC